MSKHLHKSFVTMGTEPVSLARSSWWATTPGKALVVGVAVAAVAAVSGPDLVDETRAAFSDGASVVAQVDAGSLDVLVNEEQGNPTDVLLTMPPGSDVLAPGKPIHLTMNLRNAGNLPAKVSTNLTGKGPTFLGAQLDATLTAAPQGAAAVSNSAKANGLALKEFTIAGGATVPVTLDLVLPGDTGNNWQKISDELRVVFTAVQD